MGTDWRQQRQRQQQQQKQPEHKTVVIDIKTWKRILQYAEAGDTYDQVLNRMVDYLQDKRKTLETK